MRLDLVSNLIADQKPTSVVSTSFVDLHNLINDTIQWLMPRFFQTIYEYLKELATVASAISRSAFVPE